MLKKLEQWWVYIVTCADGTLYTGTTNNLEKRIQKHNRGTGAKYTRSRIPVVLVYSEIYENRSLASQREYVIKQLSLKRKRELLAKAPTVITHIAQK